MKLNPSTAMSHPKQQPSILVFVYGSLKRGKHNHRLMNGQRFVGEARTQPAYRLLNLGSYPGMIEATSDGRSIHGEVWAVDASCKRELDWLEGVDHGHYRCVPARLCAPFSGTEVLTYLYALKAEGWPDVGDKWAGASGSPSMGAALQ